MNICFISMQVSNPLLLHGFPINRMDFVLLIVRTTVSVPLTYMWRSCYLGKCDTAVEYWMQYMYFTAIFNDGNLGSQNAPSSCWCISCSSVNLILVLKLIFMQPEPALSRATWKDNYVRRLSMCVSHSSVDNHTLVVIRSFIDVLLLKTDQFRLVYCHVIECQVWPLIWNITIIVVRTSTSFWEFWCLLGLNSQNLNRDSTLIRCPVHLRI